MRIIKKYTKPKSIEEAYTLLKSDDNSQIVGGGVYLNLNLKEISLAVDLYEAGLNYISETEDSVEIGAMTTLRDIEKSEIIRRNFGDLLSDSLKDIVGVQLKNSATIGGSIYPKYGFSDIITALLVLKCNIVFYRFGERKLSTYLEERNVTEDILTKIIIKKDKFKSSFKSMRNSFGDFSTINVAVLKNDEGYKITIGARPSVASLTLKAMDFLDSQKNIDEFTAQQAAEIACCSLKFGSNNLASKEYRKELSRVLIKRAILEVENERYN